MPVLVVRTGGQRLVAEASGLFYPITWLVGCFIGTESFDDCFNTSSRRAAAPEPDLVTLAARRPSMAKTAAGDGGAKGSGAPHGPRNGAYRDGAHTNEMRALRKLVAGIIKVAG